MSNRPRHLDDADEAVTAPGRAAPTTPGDSAALPAVAASPDSDAGTEEQQKTTNAWVLEILCKGGLVVDIRDEDGEFTETPIGRAVPILLAQGALTEDMARGLMTLYEANVARIGAAEHSIGYKSILEAIQRGSRETLYDASSERQEDNPFYGYFAYAVDLGERVIEVSIIEAIAWLEHTGRLNAAEAYYLRITCMENMRQAPYRKTLNRNLTPKEVKKELKDLDEKALEITDPTNDMARIAALEAQLDEGDFTLHVTMRSGNLKEVDFLDGIFRYVQDGTIDMTVAIRLAKKCINEMLRHRHGRESIIDKIEWIHAVELINNDELRELLGCIITDPDELERRIGSAVDLSSGGEGDDEDGQSIIDGPPVPDAGVRPPDDVPTYPEVSLLITGRRLAIVAAGLLVITGAALYASLRGRNDTNPTDDAVTVGITSTETDSEPEPEPRAVDQARFGSEAEAPAPEPIPTPARKPATAEPTPAAATPAPQVTADGPAESEVPQSITIPVTVKQSGSGNLKIDTTDAARTAWVTMGYTVSVSMGVNGKIIRLTDSKGNVYQVETENLIAATTELPAILRAAQ